MSTDAESGNGKVMRHDIWLRYVLNFCVGLFVAGMFYKGMVDATADIRSRLEEVVTKQQTMIDQMSKLTTAEEKLAEHVSASDRRQDDDHHRIERLEDGKR